MGQAFLVGFVVRFVFRFICIWASELSRFDSVDMVVAQTPVSAVEFKSVRAKSLDHSSDAMK